MNQVKQEILENVFHFMVSKPVEQGKVVKIGKHQVFKDDSQDYPYVVEKFEYTENGQDMLSVHDGYGNLLDAVNVALHL